MDALVYKVDARKCADCEASSVESALAAFDLVIRQHVPLVGIRDLQRWQIVQNRLLNSVGGRPRYANSNKGSLPGGAVLKLALPDVTMPEKVVVAPETIQASQIAAVVGPGKLVKFRSKLWFQDGTFSVPQLAMNSTDIQHLNSLGVKVSMVKE